MEFRIAVVLDRVGRVAQTAVLATDAASRSEGHRLLHLLDPEVEVFSQRVCQILARDREAP